MILLGDTRQVLHPDVALEHQPLGAEGEVRGRRGQTRLLAPRLEEARADHAVRHLLEPEDEHAVAGAARHPGGTEREGRSAARAAGLHVDGRHAGEPEGGEDLVAGRHPAVDRAAERRLEVPPSDTRVLERRPHGVTSERGEAPIGETAEGMHAHAGDVDRPHASTSGRKL